MAKPKQSPAAKPILGPPRWDASYATFLTGRSHIDGTDAVAIQLERKWGCGRLRLLVDNETREKFDRQRFLYSSAICNGSLDEVRREATRMLAGWMALDRMATTAGYGQLSTAVWEVTMEDGTVAAIVQDAARASQVAAEGRKVAIYTLEEIGRLLSHYRAVVAAKLTYPGATVTRVKAEIDDPTDAIVDGVVLGDKMDDPIPDMT
jgi:hypothetical protein